MHGHLVCLEEITQIAGICKANTLCGYKVVLHFNDRGLLTLQVKLVRYLASRKSAADNNNAITDLLVAEEEVNRLNSLFKALYGYLVGNRTGCDDNLIGTYQNITITGSTTWSLTGRLA